eukprot:4206734-Alexandrium_andersonii.AAC.1
MSGPSHNRAMPPALSHACVAHILQLLWLIPYVGVVWPLQIEEKRAGFCARHVSERGPQRRATWDRSARLSPWPQ